MTGIPKTFIVEYSMLQCATTIRTLDAVVQNNRENVAKGFVTDYIPIGAFDSREQADRFIKDFQPTLDQQKQFPPKDRNWRHIGDVLEKLVAQAGT